MHRNRFASAGVEARAVEQLETFAAAVQFSKAEGTPALAAGASVTPAPESAHAVRVAIDEALKCKVTDEKKVIAFNLSGHGHFDTPPLPAAPPRNSAGAGRTAGLGATAAIAGASVMAYEAYHHGQLEDFEYPAEKVAEAMTHLPKVPAM